MQFRRMMARQNLDDVRERLQLRRYEAVHWISKRAADATYPEGQRSRASDERLMGDVSHMAQKGHNSSAVSMIRRASSLRAQVWMHLRLDEITLEAAIEGANAGDF